MRHRPPGPAAHDPARRTVFTSALEQAEQLFIAAERVGYASRSLLIFYGLSQAGRAVAAAATRASATAWNLTEHGIKARSLTLPLPRVEVRDNGEVNLTVTPAKCPSFLYLADILGSETLPKMCSLAALWDTIPELREYPLGAVSDRAPVLFVTQEITNPGPLNPLVYVRLSGLPERLVGASDQRLAVSQFLAAYPTLSNFEFTGDPSGRPGLMVSGGVVELGLAWRSTSRPIGNYDTRAARLKQLTTPYRGDDMWAFPALAGNTAPLHPLMTWWAVLYALSMLARYQPANWTALTDIDQSEYALPLESILNVALDACPDMILRAIRTASV